MNIRELEKLLKTKKPKEIFGDDPDKVFRDYSVVCHPDLTGGDDTLFKALQEAYESINAKMGITCKHGKYYVSQNPLFDGDISNIYGHNNIYAKISKHPSVDKFLVREHETLTKLVEMDQSGVFIKLLPSPIDSILIQDTARIKLRCNLYQLQDSENLYSLSYIKSQPKYSGGLHIADFAWMFNRLLSILGYLHAIGYVHSSIIPEHFLVNIKNHGGTLLGLSHMVANGTKPDIVSSKYETMSYYPKEIVNRDQVLPETDLYMAGKLGILMLGNSSSVDRRITNFLNSLCIEKISARACDAWQIHDEFNDLLKVVVGKRHFREFTF